jgi:thiol:disulfide interchange protein DsbG
VWQIAISKKSFSKRLFMQKIILVVLMIPLTLALISGAFISGGLEARAASEPAMPPTLENMVKEGAASRYLGRENNLDGWMMIKNGQMQYFYVTPDQQSILLGILFNARGDVVTLRQLDQLRAKEGPALDALVEKSVADAPSLPGASTPPDAAPKAETHSGPSRSEDMMKAVEATASVTLGSPTAPILYAFIDPECSHCHDMLKDFRASGALEDGRVQLKIIPVGIVSEKSLNEAAILLSAPNANELLLRDLDGDQTALSAPAAGVTPNKQAVERNMMVMQDWRMDATPFAVYRSRSGEVKILRGRPNDLNKILADLR